MKSTNPHLAFEAVRVPPKEADFRAVTIPKEWRYLTILSGWRLIPGGSEREGEEVLGLVSLPPRYGKGPRCIRIPELEDRRDPTGVPFNGWTYLGSQTGPAAALRAWEFEWLRRYKPDEVSWHALAARARQLQDLFPPVAIQQDSTR